MLALLGACAAMFCQSEALAPVLARLSAGAPVHIIQIGDSHSAGDMISNGWRARLQARYGNGGRGMLAAGRPYAGYLTWGVTAFQSGGWRANATFGSQYREGGPPLGLSSFTQTARAAGETLGVSADTPDQAFDRIVVCAITGPGAGTIMLRLNMAEERWPLDAPAAAPACRTMDGDGPAVLATVTTLDVGAVSITSFGVFRRDGGVTLSNLGVVGAQLAHFGRTDDGVVRAEFAAYRPDLIVLAFGTNEGFSPALALDGYEAGLRAQVARLRRLAGFDVPILLIGPPDAGAPGEGCGDGWAPPRRLGNVREAQRRVASDLGLGFWDWSAAMGGDCAASAWARAGLMRGDHVHFTRDGGDRIGAMIDAAFLRSGDSGH